MLLDVSFKWDCLGEKKMFLSWDLCGQLWLWWLFIVLSSAVLCMLPSGGILQWDFLPSSLQGWSLGSSPGQAALPAALASQLLKKCGLLVTIQCVSLCPAPGCGCRRAGLGPATSFYCVTAADASLPAAASSAFAGCLPGSHGSCCPGWSYIGQGISQHWIYLMNLLRSCCWSLWLLKACRSPIWFTCFLSPFSLSSSWSSLQSSWASPPSHSCFPGTEIFLSCAVWEGYPLPGMRLFSWDLPQF